LHISITNVLDIPKLFGMSNTSSRRAVHIQDDAYFRSNTNVIYVSVPSSHIKHLTILKIAVFFLPKSYEKLQFLSHKEICQSQSLDVV